MQQVKMSGSKSTVKKMIKFKNLRVQVGRHTGHNFNYDKHRCNKFAKKGAAA